MDPEWHARLTEWRRHLHRNPELSLQEAGTATFVRERLSELGIPHVAGIGGHGVVATLRQGDSNRAVGLRADMDALPIEEITALPYASTRPGVMHACGHDGHTASLLGAAALLAQDTSWRGTIHLVFQPAEEGYGGARAMIADGLFARFPMDSIFGFHNWPGIDAGTVVVHQGSVMAAGAHLGITLHGTAGHAAMPHLTRDPVLAAAHVLTGLQSLVARNVAPHDGAVVSVATIEGGSAPNQIPATVRMTGTYRWFRDEVGDTLEAGIRRVVDAAAAMLGVTAEIELRRGVHAVVNTPEGAAIAAAAAADAGAILCQDRPPATASEDFGWLAEQAGGAFAWIGNGPTADLHHPAYDFNDAILPVASSWLAAAARRALAA